MATMQSVADLLIREVGNFLTTSMFRDSVNVLEPMNEAFVLSFLTTFVDTFDEKADPEVAEGLMLRAKSRAPDTLKSLLGSNKNYYDVKGDKRTPGNLLAILVDYTNYSVRPMDLAINCGDFGLPVFEEPEKRLDAPFMQQVHERAWFEIAARLAGNDPPFVPVDGRSVNLSDEDNALLTEFFLQGNYLPWVTGVGSIEACDSMVHKAKNNANFDAAYRVMSTTALTKADQKRAAKVVPMWGREFQVRGHLKVRKADPSCRTCRGSGEEVSGNRGEDVYTCDCVKLR